MFEMMGKDGQVLRIDRHGRCEWVDAPRERARITADGFWKWSADVPMSTAAKCEAIGVNPTFVLNPCAEIALPTLMDELKAFQDDLEALEELEQPSIPLEEMEQLWAEADAAQGIVLQPATRRRKHLSSR